MNVDKSVMFQILKKLYDYFKIKQPLAKISAACGHSEHYSANRYPSRGEGRSEDEIIILFSGQIFGVLQGYQQSDGVGNINKGDQVIK